MNTINNINRNNFPTIKIENNISARKNLPAIPMDSVSFTGKEKEYKYQDSWYLANETIKDQDDFSTTIVDKSHVRSTWDVIFNKKYYKKIYDLPLRLREDLNKQKTDTVIQNAPEEILDKTGLSNKEFVKEIDKINSLLNIVAPKYDLYEDKTKQEFEIKMGKEIVSVKRLSQGLSGAIYKIEVPDCKPLALKHYHNCLNVNNKEGAFPEIALSKKMNEDKVSDVAVLYCANPYNGWMLSDFVDENYEMKKGNTTFEDYVRVHRLICNDVNSGMAVESKDGYVYVDFGYIAPCNSSDIKYDEVILNDNIKRVNNKEYITSEDISGLTIIENINLFGDKNHTEMIENRYKTNPEMQFFIDAVHATKIVLSNKEIPEEMKKRLQKNYEKMGFVGDSAELIKSCNQ